MRDSSPTSFGLSAAQRVFQASSIDPEQGLNVEQVICRTTENLNISAFQQAWQEILDHHSSLRVRFGRNDKGEFYQEIQAPMEIPFTVEEQPQLKPEEQRAFLSDWLERDRRKSFALSAAPLMRIAVIRFEDSETWVWTFHHILLDGRSFLLVLEDFYAAYAAICEGRAVVFPKRTPFAEFISWHESWLQTRGNAAEAFWRNLYQDETPNPILSISRTSSPAHRRTATIKLPTEPGTSEQMHRVATECGLTLSTIVEGAWALLLKRYYDSRSVTFATIHSGRRGSIEGTKEMIGVLMNPLPVHAMFSETTSVIDFLKAIRVQQLAVREQQWSTWEMIRSSIPIAASKQLSDTCLLYERYDVGQEMTKRFGREGERTFSLRERPNIPLLLSVSEQPEMQFELSYQTAVFEAGDIGRLIQIFLLLLRQILEAPSAKLGDLRDGSRQDENPAGGDLQNGAMTMAPRCERARSVEAQSYWEDRLAELAVRPSLPMALEAKGAASARPVRHSGRLGVAEWERLREMAGKLRVTPTVLLTTAFSDVLGKWCNQRRFTLNLVRLRRPKWDAQVEMPPECVTTTSLLAINLEGTDFAHRAAEVMGTLRRDLRHGLDAGREMIERMGKRQSLPEPETMPVTFISLLRSQKKEGSAKRPDEEKSGGAAREGLASQAWLNHQVEEEEGSLHFHWDVREEVFPPGLVADMFSTYTEYVRGLAGGTAATLPGPELPASQRKRRIQYNATEGERVSGLLHAGFFATARKQPAQIAIDDTERRVSYGDLAGYAWSVSRRLRDEGVGAGDLVAVVMEKGWEQIACVLGILRAGAAYLPIDPELPKSRLEYLLSNGHVAVAFTQAHLLPVLAWPATLKVWTLARTGHLTEADESAEPGPDALAYVIYTSGSTGVPKGVMVTHQAALNTIVDINRRLEISAHDRVLAVSALSFDLSVYDIFGLLERGATVVLPAPERTRDPTHWVDRMNHCGVTIWNSAPALMQMLVTVLETSERHLPSTLRWAMLSGDWIPVDLPTRIGRFAPDCRVLSLGGATEVSIWSIAYPIERVDPAWTSIPYGMPLLNQSIHVLDDRFEPCPEWTAGEIHIGGDGLALGYLQDEAKTAERFVISPVTGARLYRTGDYGRFRPEGFVEFLGRRDTQVKIRGHRIEIGEIEAALLRLPQVREAAALILPATPGDRSSGVLVGCVVLHESGAQATSKSAAEEEKIRAALSELLPSYMIPSRIVVRNDLPLSPNGKVDRRALLEGILSTLSAHDLAPEDEPQDLLEKAIWGVWQEILPGRRIGRHDHFFEIGGDSLSVLHMVARVEKVVGRPVGLRPMQQGGTIVDLAAAARETGPATPPPMMIAMQAGGSKPPLFFAHGDLEHGGLYAQRMSHQLGPDQPLYSISPHGTFGGALPTTFESIAVSFAELVRSIQPRGPYHLGGFCNGAIAMYEVAQQLVREGETVSTLVLLDPPDLFVFLSRRKISRLGKFVGLREGQGRNWYQRIAEGIEIWQDHGTLQLLKEGRSRFVSWTIKSLKGFSKKAEPTSSVTDLNNAYYAAMARYEPTPYDGTAWMILREGESQRHPRQISYWNQFIRDVRFETVPGTHLELRGNMKEIAHVIETAMKIPSDLATAPR